MASYKVFALFALLALCVVGASATSFLQYTPLAMLQQQRCMALTMQGIMSPECQQFGAMSPITHQMQQQRCMSLKMQGIMSPECQQFGAMYPIPPVMQGMTAPWCQCGSMCNTAAMMNNPLVYPQQCVAGCSCYIDISVICNTGE